MLLASLFLVLLGAAPGDFVAHGDYATALATAQKIGVPLVVGVKCEPPTGEWMTVRVEQWKYWGSGSFVIVSRPNETLDQMDHVLDLPADGNAVAIRKALSRGGHVPLAIAETPADLTLVDHWGSWCAPCRASIPAINAAFTKFRDRIRFQGVASESSQSVLDAAVSRLGILIPQRLQNSSDSVSAYPTLRLIDSSGRTVWTHVGAIDSATLDAAIQSHLPSGRR